jgi:hypothetical protein
MTVTAASFRKDFSAFGSLADYPDADVSFWITVASRMVDAYRWGDMTDTGIELLVAHELSVEFMAKAEGAVGNQPGVARGMLASGGVDKTNFSYDTASLAEEGGGRFNATIYGQRFYRLSRLYGAGGFQVEALAGDPLSTSSITWPGIINPPF